MNNFSPFEKLGISEEADESQIKQRFNYLKIRFHPDKICNNQELTQQEKEHQVKEFSLMTQSFRMVMNPWTKIPFIQCNGNWEDAWMRAARVEMMINDFLREEAEEEDVRRRSEFLEAVENDIRRCKQQEVEQVNQVEAARRNRLLNEASNSTAGFSRQDIRESVLRHSTRRPYYLMAADPDIELLKVIPKRGRYRLTLRRKPLLITLDSSDDEN